MTRRGTVAVKYTGDNSDLKRANAEVGQDLKKTGDGFTGFGKNASLGMAVAGTAGLMMAKNLVGAAEESQQKTKQTEAVLKSMGTAANVTADDVENLADQQSKKTGVDDEMIASGQNVLLTFGKVRNEVGAGNDIFTRATKSALDMSVALGTDLQGANVMLGKALNDPLKGITALTRAGVSFTEQQKDQIRAMVESGDTLGAQKLIMAEMEKQFGGSAEAQATASAKLGVAWGNLQEQAGAALIPAMDGVAKAGTAVFDVFDSMPEPMRNTVVTGATVVAGLLAIGGTVSFAVDHLRNMKGNLAGLLPDLKNTEGGLTGVGKAVTALGVVGAVAGLAVLADSLNEVSVDADRFSAAMARGTEAQRIQAGEALIGADNLGKLDEVIRQAADSNIVAAERMLEAAEAAGMSKDRIAELRTIIDEKRDADVQGAIDQKTNTAAMQEATTAAEGQTVALEDLQAALLATFDSNLAYRQAVDGSSDAVAKLTELTNAGKTGTEEYDDALLSAESAALRQAASSVKQAEDLAKAKGETLGAEQANRLYRDQLQMVADKLAPGSPLRAQLQGYIDQLNGLDGKNVNSTVTITTIEQAVKSGYTSPVNQNVPKKKHGGGRIEGGPADEPWYQLQGGERVLSREQNQQFESAGQGGVALAAAPEPRQIVVVLQLRDQVLGQVVIDELTALGKDHGVQYLNVG